jgi:hypothetical protein
LAPRQAEVIVSTGLAGGNEPRDSPHTGGITYLLVIDTVYSLNFTNHHGGVMVRTHRPFKLTLNLKPKPRYTSLMPGFFYLSPKGSFYEIRF